MSKDKINIQGILEAIEKIEIYVRPFNNAKEFYSHTINFDAAMMNFIIIGEMLVRLTDDFKEKYHELNWTEIKNFRNIIAHDYLGINAEEVWQIITTHLRTLKHDLHKILTSLD